MTQIKELFDATSGSLWQTMQSYGNRVGFWIPVFQREYNWDKSHLKRLLEDCLNGFLDQADRRSSESFTFLGTMILVRDQQSEPSFGGTSLTVIDGQQRITTLVLLCCALIQRLTELEVKPMELPAYVRDWVRQEHQSVTTHLFECTNGSQLVGARNYFFPRIVRAAVDTRSSTPQKSEYISDVSKFLNDFAKYFRDESHQVSSSEDIEHGVYGNYRYLLEQVDRFVANTGVFEDQSDGEEIPDTKCVPQESFQTSHMKTLLEHINTLSEDDANRVMSYVSSGCDHEAYFRLIYFSWYLLKRVVITRIETTDADNAFDIFDALNTTGEPLTAIETLKPLVMHHANTRDPDIREGSILRFEQLEEYLYGEYDDPERRQKESKQLVLLFALYQYGKKIGFDLKQQRNFLRNRFPSGPSFPDSAVYEFINSFVELAQFRRDYWTPEGLRGIDGRHPSNELTEQLKLCLSFVLATKTEMTIPVLTRYWSQYYDNRSEQEFVAAVKAVTAYLVLRRSTTGGTSGIDREFRGFMETLQLEDSPTPLPISALKSMLRDSLAKTRIGVVDKLSWVERASLTAIGNRSRPVSRLLLLAAAHNSKPDERKRGQLTRAGIIPSEEIAYFTPAVWNSDLYKTVEHIAPESPREADWPSAIYRDRELCHTIGNLVLLPQNENRSASNSSWAKKKLFYSALTADSDDKRIEQIAQAKASGIKFSRKTINALATQGRLRMLDSIAAANKWDDGVIRDRSRNILSLAWDQFGDWLFD